MCQGYRWVTGRARLRISPALPFRTRNSTLTLLHPHRLPVAQRAPVDGEGILANLACREAPQPTVSQPGLAFLRDDTVQIEAELPGGLPHGRFHVEVEQVICQMWPHQKFGRQRRAVMAAAQDLCSARGRLGGPAMMTHPTRKACMGSMNLDVVAVVKQFAM